MTTKFGWMFTLYAKHDGFDLTSVSVGCTLNKTVPLFIIGFGGLELNKDLRPALNSLVDHLKAPGDKAILGIFPERTAYSTRPKIQLAFLPDADAENNKYWLSFQLHGGTEMVYPSLTLPDVLRLRDALSEVVAEWDKWVESRIAISPPSEPQTSQ